MARANQRYLGLYRGTVINNVDPLQIGRIMALVPDVSGQTPSSWAMPCAPVAGQQMGIFVVPQVGSGVWVQYEGGDVDRPVWVGGWWANAGQTPPLAHAGGPPSDPNIVLQSALQNALVISDTPGPTGGITLKSTTGATIVVNDTGIYIQNGRGASIVMVGPTVTINEGALEIT